MIYDDCKSFDRWRIKLTILKWTLWKLGLPLSVRLFSMNMFVTLVAVSVCPKSKLDSKNLHERVLVSLGAPFIQPCAKLATHEISWHQAIADWFYTGPSIAAYKKIKSFLWENMLVYSRSEKSYESVHD